MFPGSPLLSKWKGLDVIAHPSLLMSGARSICFYVFIQFTPHPPQSWENKSTCGIDFEIRRHYARVRDAFY